jgi:GntR family transcriptional repressor for pyruvate dehydrogenase complex
MNMVASILFDVRSKTVHRAHDLKESAEMHRQIFRGIREGNVETARNAMRDHLLLAQKAQAEELAASFSAMNGVKSKKEARKSAPPKKTKTK